MSKQAQCILVALGACLLGSTIVGIVTLAQWLNPTTPALILIGAALLPAVVGGILVISPSDQHPWTRDIVITGALPGLIFGIVAVAIGLLWNVPQVRANAASKIPSTFQDAKPLLQALNDSEDLVAVSACKNLAKSNFEHVYGESISTISDRPKVAVACFQNAGPHSDDIVFRLSENWHRALAHHDSDEQSACELSDALSDIASSHAVNTAQLMDCALNSPSPSAQQCCSQSLNRHTTTSQELANKLSSVPDLLVSFALAPHLISASFTGHPQLGSLILETPGFQKIALRSACSSLQYDSATTVSAFYQLAQTLECLPSSDDPPTRLITWTHICEEMTPQLANHVKAQPANVFCDTLTQELQRQAQPLPMASPEDLHAMAQLAEDIEYAAVSDMANDLNRINAELGHGKVGVDYENITSDELSVLQQILNETMNKTARPKHKGASFTAQEVKDLTKFLAESKDQIPDMLNGIEKKSDLTKKQRDSLKSFQDTINDNPNLLKPTP